MLEAMANNCIPVVFKDVSYGSMDIYKNYWTSDTGNKSMKYVVSKINDIITGKDYTHLHSNLVGKPIELLDQYRTVEVMKRMSV